MQEFKSKQEVVEAIKYVAPNGNISDVADWLRENGVSNFIDNFYSEGRRMELEIPCDGQQPIRVNAGEYLVKSSDGAFFSMNERAFNATYILCGE